MFNVVITFLDEFDEYGYVRQFYEFDSYKKALEFYFMKKTFYKDYENVLVSSDC